MSPAVMSAIVIATESARSGVTYTSRNGALCPWCGKKTKVYKTMKWEDSTRVRYHHCEASGCLLHEMGTSIKSVEVE